MVTHNEMFLRALAERLIVFQDNKITVFEGDYESFLKKVGWNEERNEAGEQKLTGARPAADTISGQVDRSGKNKNGDSASFQDASFKFKLSPRELRKLRSEVIIEKSRVLKPLEERVLQLERQIEETEQRVNQLTQDIIAASVDGRGQEVVRLSKELDSGRKSLDSLYEEYTQVYQEYEEKSQSFERRLQEIERLSS